MVFFDIVGVILVVYLIILQVKRLISDIKQTTNHKVLNYAFCATDMTDTLNCAASISKLLNA